MVTILYRYAESKGATASSDGGAALDAYPDAAKTDAWALDAMRWAAANGLLADARNQATLRPTDAAIRGEIATVLMRYLVEQ